MCFNIEYSCHQGCQLSRIRRDSHAFDLLLTHSRIWPVTHALTQLTNLLTHLKKITRILGLSRFTHVMIRFDSVRSRSDRFDPIHYPFVQTNTTKISSSECHLNDLLNKITMNKMTMNKIMMNKEHKIHHNTSASNCNNVILFVMLDKI